MKEWLLPLVATAIVPFAMGDPVAQVDPNQPEFVANFAGSVPPAARPAIQAGLNEWAARVDARVPVVIDVTWEALPQFVAAASQPLAYSTDPDTGYQLPIALANQRAGQDLDPGRSDIRLTFSSRERWQYDVNTPAPAGVVDLMTFTLHEVGHGIGFYSSSQKQGNGLIVFGSSYGEGAPGPTLLDSMLITSAGGLLIDPNPVANVLKSVTSALTNQPVYWGGDAKDASGGRPRMSSGAFEPHTSLMHLDENTYPPGNPDSLMTPTIRRAETNHSIGPAALGILRNLGWTMQAAAPPPPASTAPSGAAAATKPATPRNDAAAATSETTAPPAVDVAGGSNGATPERQASVAGQRASADSPLWPGFVVASLALAGATWRVLRRVRSAD